MRSQRPGTGCSATMAIERTAVPSFTDVTDRAGVGGRAVGMGVAVGDVDNDGWLDLYVTAFGSNTLYRNRGDGTFADVTGAAHVDDPRWSTSAAFFDYDRDGDLDLFVVNYVAFTVAGNKACTDKVGARDYCPPGAYAAGARSTVPERRRPALHRRDRASGIATAVRRRARRRGRRPRRRRLARRLRRQRRDAEPALDEPARRHVRGPRPALGHAFNGAGRPEGSMGIALGDADGDGDEDLFVTNIVGETHVLYLNDGHGNFEDARARAGLAAPTAGMTGFGTDWFDYDNDGRLELFLTNGAVNIIEGQRGQPVPYRQPSQLLHNEGNGRFRDVSAEAGDGVRRGSASGAALRSATSTTMATWISSSRRTTGRRGCC